MIFPRFALSARLTVRAVSSFEVQATWWFRITTWMAGRGSLAWGFLPDPLLTCVLIYLHSGIRLLQTYLALHGPCNINPEDGFLRLMLASYRGFDRFE